MGTVFIVGQRKKVIELDPENFKIMFGSFSLVAFEVSFSHYKQFYVRYH